MEDPSGAANSIYEFDRLSEEEKTDARNRYISDMAFDQLGNALEKGATKPYNPNSIKISGLHESARSAADSDIEAMEREHPDRYKLQIELDNVLNKLDKLLGKPKAKKLIDGYSLEYSDVKEDLMRKFFKDHDKNEAIEEPSDRKISDATLERILSKEEKDKYPNTLRDLFYVRSFTLNKIKNLDA